MKFQLTESKALEKSSFSKTPGVEVWWQKEMMSWANATQSIMFLPRIKADCSIPIRGAITVWRRLARTLVMILKVVLRRLMGLKDERELAPGDLGWRMILA